MSETRKMIGGYAQALLMYKNTHILTPTIPVINPDFPSLLPVFFVLTAPKIIANIPVGKLI